MAVTITSLFIASFFIGTVLCSDYSTPFLFGLDKILERIRNDERKMKEIIKDTYVDIQVNEDTKDLIEREKDLREYMLGSILKLNTDIRSKNVMTEVDEDICLEVDNVIREVEYKLCTNEAFLSLLEKDLNDVKVISIAIFYANMNSNKLPFCIDNNKSEEERLYDLGMSYKRFDIRKAAKYFYKAAQRNNVDAMYELGKICRRDNGCSIDYGGCDKWFTEAGVEGHAGAMFELAKINRSLGDVMQADSYLKKASEKGHAGALYLLGKQCENRDEFER